MPGRIVAALLHCYVTGTNGVYVGMQDFWIDLITGRLSLQIKHAQKTTLFVRGQSQLCPIHPAVTISLTDFKLKLRLDGLYLKGERGTKVPDAKVCVGVVPAGVPCFLCA